MIDWSDRIYLPVDRKFIDEKGALVLKCYLGLTLINNEPTKPIEKLPLSDIKAVVKKKILKPFK